MKQLKYIAHPHVYIIFFIIVSLLALIPNGLGWRGDMLGYSQDFIGLYILYTIFYFLGYKFINNIKTPNHEKLNINMFNFFHFVFFLSFLFFILKFIYISGIPLFSDTPYLRIRLSKLGGFVDFPTKAMSLLGVIAYYFFIKRKNKLYLTQFFVSILLNLLFAERSLIVFTIIGAVILYVNYNTISVKVFKRVLISGFLVLFLIGWVQILRHGGKNHLNLSGEMSTLEVAAWVVHGDLTGSQKFGAYVANQLNEERLYGKYTLGIYLSLFIPNYKEHGATYLQKHYTKSKTAQSAAIPYSYFIDFGYFSLVFPFVIGVISRFLYDKFKSLNSPLFIVLYIAYFFNLLWSVRAGNFPIDPKLVYFTLLLVFIFNPKMRLTINNQIIQLLRVFFLITLGISLIALLLRW